MQRWSSFVGVMAVLGFAATAAGQQALDDAEAVQHFETRVRPLLAEHCYSCHGPKKQQGGLRLDSAAALRKGSDTGPIVVPGKPKDSLLIRVVNHDGDVKMPPKSKLKPEEIVALTEWVRKGAALPVDRVTSNAGLDIPTARKSYWAFQPIRSPVSPLAGVAPTPIDAFILAALQAKRLTPVEPADRRTLVRRVTYDLTGLPPTPEEVDAALRDGSPEWYEKVVDRLLASPHYGERWGRHWLDLVRYSDTAGDNSDYPVPQLYLYRNWVIAALNQDKPYDQFLREQLAGDLLPAANEQDRREKLIATGYLANARRFGSYEDARYPWHLTIEDTIDNLGRTVLGMTINCCRCHDHKFDALTNEDYYALYGFFSSTRYPWPGIELDKAPKDLVALASAEEIERVRAERQPRLTVLEEAVRQLEVAQTAAEQSLLEAQKLDRDEERLAQIAGLQQRVEDVKKAFREATKQRDQFVSQPPPFPVAYAMIDGTRETKKRTGVVGNAHVQIKGDPERLGKEVPRRFPLMLGGQGLPADSKGSGRLQLAEWLTDPANPLTARVLVNRVWQHHFGKGIVATPSDFGRQGQPPTHPELLDWLARRFIDSGWSIKALHRDILLSAAYQRSSRDDDANAAIDIANDYLSRFGRRRLDAEAIRDTLLTVSGGLDRSPGGPHPFAAPPTWNYTQHNPFKAVYETNRRSVYLMTQRIQRHPFLGLFDGADTNASTARRQTSTTPLQALYLMNDPFVHAQARRLAERLLTERADDATRIERAYALLFGRPADAEERAAATEYLVTVRDKLQGQEAKAWESFVRVLFMSNEFVYVN